jgi:hypothetical protein
MTEMSDTRIWKSDCILCAGMGCAACLRLHVQACDKCRHVHFPNGICGLCACKEPSTGDGAPK